MTIARPAKATTDQLREALAELEASQRRVVRDAAKAEDAAREKVVRKLLPVLDNLDRSIQAASTDASGWLEGINLVRSQLTDILRDFGVEQFHAVGQRFDPSLHEAVGITLVDDPEHEGHVMEQWQAGYRFGERLLRPAIVRVGKLTQQ